jgi:uncharacterized membrane protein YbhN (UPF0104 family)
LNQEVEFLKIQVLANYYHSQFTILASFSFSITIAWLVILITLLFQEVISPETYFSGIIFVIAVLMSALFFIRMEYHKNLDKIDKLLHRLEKREPLPSLKELRRSL